MMLGVDKLEVVTHQLMRGQQIVKEKVVRMPFVGYRTTSGDRCVDCYIIGLASSSALCTCLPCMTCDFTNVHLW